jgi:ATP-binding cassette, subfamily A (ABC1), member 3
MSLSMIYKQKGIFEMAIMGVWVVVGWILLWRRFGMLERNRFYQKGNDELLECSGLRKTYPNGFTAVKDLNVKMYTGQIFALLGHNGAGKTTVISMLTGLLSPTAGEAQAFGHDIFSDITSVREFLGVCPQHNILFDMLTPREHLEIFSDFKGNINIIILICIYL